MKNFIGIQQRHLIPTYPNRGLTITKGEGVYLYDTTGKKYLDLMSNMGVNILGHSNPFLNKRLKSQISSLVSLHCSFSSDIRSQAIQKLLTFLPANLRRVYLCSTGTETVEAALKFAICATGRVNFIAAENGYHGKTIGSLALTSAGSRKYQRPFWKILPKFRFVKYGDTSDLREKLDKTVAGVILEPIQGEGGIIIPPANYLKDVTCICQKNNVLLILDEVQTGMGRTGTFLACQKYAVSPDILCLSKGLGGGIPIGATVTTEPIATKIPKGTQTSTFGGNPLACSACLAVLDYMEKDDLVKHAGDMGAYFIKKLRGINSKKIKEVRGRGLMIGLELNVDATEILKKMQESGIIAAPSNDQTIRFLPPLIIEKDEIDFAVSRIGRILRE